MQPERRGKAELHPEGQPHHDGTQHKDHADRGAVTGVMRAQVEAANLAVITHVQQIAEQPSLATARTAAGQRHMQQ